MFGSFLHSSFNFDQSRYGQARHHRGLGLGTSRFEVLIFHDNLHLVRWNRENDSKKCERWFVLPKHGQD